MDAKTGDGRHDQRPLIADAGTSGPPASKSIVGVHGYVCSCHPAPVLLDTPETRSRDVSEMPAEDGEEGEATEATNDDAGMMAMMGMAGFGSTKVRMSTSGLYDYGRLIL